MATEIESRSTASPARTDSIRVVPLHGIDDLTGPIGAATPAVAPQLTYRGGPLLTPVQVFTDALTQTSSHELCEAITDAVPGTGWYDDHNGEIRDICAWKAKKVGGYTVQLEWSDKANNSV